MCEAGRFGTLVRRGHLDKAAHLHASRIQSAARSSRFLQRQAVQGCGDSASVPTQVMINLIYFAAQTKNDGSGDVGVIQNAFKGPLQLLRVLPHSLTAAIAMRKSNNAIYIGRQRLSLKLSAIRLAVNAAQLLAATTAR